MLRRLEIENYGLIARAVIEFAGGATIFTGETGTGKTMLLGALSFVLGARAGSDVVRRGASKAIVTLAFDPSDVVRRRLAEDGFEVDAGEEATIVREMSDAGRSSVRVNARASTAGYVRELGDAIAEIVGQHEAQRLLAPAYHLELLDRFAGDDAVLARTEVATSYARRNELSDALAQVAGDDRRARERYEDACFAVREIDEARIELGEDQHLEGRRRFLDHAERIAVALRRAHDALAGDEGSAIGALGDARATLASISEVAAELGAVADQTSALQSEAGEIAATIAKSLEETEFDPGELETINARLDTIDRLKRKYGGSIEAVLAHANDDRAVTEEYEGRDRRVAELTGEVAAVTRELESAAAKLTAARKKAAATLSKRVIAEFGDLALGSGRFEVALETLDAIGASGAERVEFLFAANVGEPARPLSRVVSGGELSRVLLALIVVLAGLRGDESALVFDEIDAGVGGATATAVGARIGRLAGDAQVICVTHLAQLATWADRHYVLEKTETKNETTISTREVSGANEREAEIARMLSGESHDAALRHARALLEARPLSP